MMMATASHRPAQVWRRIVAALTGIVALTGCSSFNMAPKCEDSGQGVMRTLIVPGNERPDYARLGAIMTVSDFEEISSSYNRRICHARLSAFGQSIDLRYEVRQSEGVRNWFEVKYLNPDDPGMQPLITLIRSAYAS